MLGVLLGLSLVGGTIGWYLYFQAKRANARLDEEKVRLTQEKQIVLEFMHNLAEALGEGVDREQLFQRVVHAAVLSTGALSAAVFERTGDRTLTGRAVEGLFPPLRPIPKDAEGGSLTRAKLLERVLRSETVDFADSLVGEVARTGQGLLIPDGQLDPRVVRHDDPSLVVRSLVVAPMTFRDKLLGVLAVANSSDGLSFSETDFSLVRSLAEQAAVAIHNLDLLSLQIEKNRLDLDIEIASSIQALLLPSGFPEDPRIDVAAFYRPAQKIGGDLYDVFALSGGRIGVAIADVSGKGVPASLLMAICQSNLRHIARQHDSPSKALAALNAELAGEVRRGMFVTLVYAIVDPDRREVVLARAGHELPLLASRGQDGTPSVKPVGLDGMALGMVPPAIFDAVIEDLVLPFGPGDALLLYTDGATEAVNGDGTEFSASRLADVLREHRAASAEAINQAVVAAVTTFAESSAPGDDLTLLTLRYR